MKLFWNHANNIETIVKLVWLLLAWFPIKELAFELNKEKFQDAIRVSYNWSISSLPFVCFAIIWRCSMSFCARKEVQQWDTWPNIIIIGRSMYWCKKRTKNGLEIGKRFWQNEMENKRNLMKGWHLHRWWSSRHGRRKREKEKM